MTGASSTSQAPPPTLSARPAAATEASRVLPAPPGPTRVTSRFSASCLITWRELLVAADEAGERGAQVAVAGHRRLGLAAQDGQVRGAQLGRGVGAQLVGEPPAELLVGGQRLGGAPGRRERPEPQRAEPLAQRVRAAELLQLGHQGGRPAQAQLRLDAVLGGGQA